MRTLVLWTAILAVSPAVSADKLPPPPPATKSAKGGENADLKGLAGTWTCAGTGRGAAGAVTYKARLVLRWDLGGNWLAVRREVQLPRPGSPLVSDGWLGWDAAGKRYWLVAMDSEGGWVDLGAAGWEGSSLVLTGAGAAEGKRRPLRYTLTRGKTEKDLLFAVETQAAGSANWMLVAQDTCRR